MRSLIALSFTLLAATAGAEPLPASPGPSALSGLHRVATASPGAGGLTLFSGAGYGYASSVMGDGDSHHRASAVLAASLCVTEWLALGLRMDGRYDAHRGLSMITGGDDRDDGMIGEPRLLAEVRTGLGAGWHAGGRLTVWLPGADAPSLVPGATTVDGLAVVGYASPDGPWQVALNAGFRLDRSAASVEEADKLSQADRLSLGVSDANAVLVGAGLGYRIGAAELFGEVTWDVLVGADAPVLRGSPLRAAAGVRVAVGAGVGLGLTVEANAAELPTAEADDPLLPYEPRLSVMAGLVYRIGGFGGRSEAPAPVAETAPEEPVVETAPIEPTRPAEPATPAPGVVEGRVSGAGGVAVSNAVVALEAGEAARELSVDEDGRFRFEEVASGPVSVAVQAEGFEPVTDSFELAPGQTRSLELTLEPALPEGQIRGTVRSFRGSPVSAEVTVEPLGETVETDAEGRFEVDVAPGEYRVVIKAKGYRSQRRRVTVEEGGVVILNIDLRRRRRGS
ncbi:carboxypeptidase regulatory-like domain-containing protein [Haliangium sp.]|uniref:carboxypeptidase-like regulatory domain-containing protein n=1 Tax=Haliangium sp. TaxID=2663208 RepID=UPI003D14A366